MFIPLLENTAGRPDSYCKRTVFTKGKTDVDMRRLLAILIFFLWIRGRMVRLLSLVSKDFEFIPFVRPSVVEIYNHC